MLQQKQDFFKIKQINKCDKCRIKKSDQEVYLPSACMKKSGTGDLLIITDMIEYSENYKKLQEFLERKEIFNYQIYSACNCRTKNFEIPSPIHGVYSYCKSFNIDKLDYKCIMVIGRAINFVTQSDDISSWLDFSEYIFNQTYFWYKGKKVFPVSFVSEWLKTDNFQRFFVIKQLEKIKQELKSPQYFQDIPYNIIEVQDADDFLLSHKEEGELAWDTETSSLNHFDPNFRVGCLTLSFDGIDGYYLPFEKINKRILSQFFKNKYQITANGKFDIKAMLRMGIQNSKVDEDITILAHLLNTERTLNGLKSLAWLVNMGGYEKELDNYIQKYKIKNYLDIPHSIMKNYATLDAIVTYRVHKFLMNELVPRQQMVYDTYKKYVIPVIPIFIKAEMHGMLIDKKYLNELDSNLDKEISELESTIKKDLNTNADINSDEQLAKALEKNGLPDLGRVKKGHYKTGDAILQAWKKRGFEIAELILKHRALSKLQSSFVGSVEEEEEISNKSFFNIEAKEKVKQQGLAKYIAEDGYIHATFNPARADTYRGTGADPNLQQMPKRGYEGKRFRPVFGCPEDYYLCESDYSGYQLRIVCIESQDKVMEDIFINLGGDMHSMTANGVFCRDITLEEFLSKKDEEPHKTHRDKSKGVNFGFIFLRSAYGFKSDLEENWTDEEINEYIKENNLKIIIDKQGNEDTYLTVSTEIRKNFFETYRGLEPWGDKKIEFAKKNGYIDCMLGGRRHTPSLTYISKEGVGFNKWVDHYEKIAVNSSAQTFEVLSIYKAMVDINKKIVDNNYKSIIVGNVHDSIVSYIHRDELEHMWHIIKNNMEDHNSYRIPILCDINYGKVWGFSPNMKTIEDVKKFKEKEGIE